MIDQFATLADFADRLDPSIRPAVKWLVAWYYAWEFCEHKGWCDGISGHQFRRLTVQASEEKVQPSQTAMRLWIRRMANAPYIPPPQPEIRRDERR